MEAFRGTVPLVPCRELSGADCDLVVSADDAACPAGHAVPTRDLPDDDLPVSGRYRPRARLAGHEDFEEVSYEDEAAIVARIVGDPSALAVSRTAAEPCAQHHGVDADRARAELRHLVSTALGCSAYTRTAGGYWKIRFKGMTASLSPPGTVILSYTTRHYERLPSEVIGGAPSRFGAQRSRAPRLAGPPLPLEEIQAKLAEQPRFAARLIASWARRQEIDDDTAVEELTHRFREDLMAGRWQAGERPGTWLLTGQSQWGVAADTAEVLATWPPTAPSQ